MISFHKNDGSNVFFEAFLRTVFLIENSRYPTFSLITYFYTYELVLAALLYIRVSNTRQPLIKLTCDPAILHIY